MIRSTIDVNPIDSGRLYVISYIKNHEEQHTTKGRFEIFKT